VSNYEKSVGATLPQWRFNIFVVIKCNRSLVMGLIALLHLHVRAILLVLSVASLVQF